MFANLTIYFLFRRRIFIYSNIWMIAMIDLPKYSYLYLQCRWYISKMEDNGDCCPLSWDKHNLRIIFLNISPFKFFYISNIILIVVIYVYKKLSFYIMCLVFTQVKFVEKYDFSFITICLFLVCYFLFFLKNNA